MRNALRKMCVLAGVAIMATCANAFIFDAKIVIDRALNSPTLTIKYSGATAALAELRINGTSIGTRPLNADRTTGETNFSLNLGSLSDGDNEIEVRLFDKSGKLVGTEKTIIQVDDPTQRPIYLTMPKMGETVQGPVEIKLGFNRELRNVYASFFINNQFKAMTNTPPFNFLWDTSRETNGWHEIEAWVVDESSNTLKTRKIRIFVNNPGGRTDRVATTNTIELATSSNTVKVADPGGPAGLRTLGQGGGRAVDRSPENAPPVATGLVSTNPIKTTVTGDASGVKQTRIASALATGQKHLTPTGTRVAPPEPEKVVVKAEPPTTTTTTTTNTTNTTNTTTVKTDDATVSVVAKTEPPVVVVTKSAMQKPPTAETLSSVRSVATTISITKGQRLPNLPSFAVMLNSQFVDFDVNPRVDAGVPMTPFRHLIEKAGGEVGWENATKTVNAFAEGREIFLRIGDRLARIDALSIELELAPYLDRGRTIVPLSFIRESLNVEVEYDPATGHVLITSKK